METISSIHGVIASMKFGWRILDSMSPDEMATWRDLVPENILRWREASQDMARGVDVYGTKTPDLADLATECMGVGVSENLEDSMSFWKSWLCLIPEGSAHGISTDNLSKKEKAAADMANAMDKQNATIQKWIEQDKQRVVSSAPEGLSPDTWYMLIVARAGYGGEHEPLSPLFFSAARGWLSGQNKWPTLGRLWGNPDGWRVKRVAKHWWGNAGDVVKKLSFRRIEASAAQQRISRQWKAWMDGQRQQPVVYWSSEQQLRFLAQRVVHLLNELKPSQTRDIQRINGWACYETWNVTREDERFFLDNKSTPVSDNH